MPAKETPILARVFHKNFHLPNISSTAMRFIQAAERPNSTTVDLARVLGEDQVMAAKALRLANSVAYGQSRQVTSLRQAIEVVGTYDLMAITVASSLPATVKNAPVPPQHWKHAALTAEVAKHVASGFGSSPGKAFIGGLLHSIGVLIIEIAIPEDSEKIALAAGKDAFPMERVQAERELLGFDSAAVGAEAMRRWTLPNDISTSLDIYPDADLADRLTPGIVNWSSRAAAELLNLGHLSEPIAQSAIKQGMTKEGLEDWATNLMASSESLLESIR